MSELDDFVSDEETEVDTTVEMTAESQETESQEPTDSQTELTTEDEQGVTGEPPAPEPQPDSPPEPVMVPLAAKQAEKERRQKAEQELYALRQQQAQTPLPDAYLEPDKAIAHAAAQVEERMMSMYRSNSEANARKNHEDFDEKMAVFAELAQQQPHLIQELSNEFDPGEYVYQVANQHLEMKEVGNLSEYKSKFEADTEARIRAEVMAEMEANKPTAKSPPDLSTVRSTGGDPVTEYADGNEGLEQMLGR